MILIGLYVYYSKQEGWRDLYSSERLPSSYTTQNHINVKEKLVRDNHRYVRLRDAGLKIRARVCICEVRDGV